MVEGLRNCVSASVASKAKAKGGCEVITDEQAIDLGRLAEIVCSKPTIANRYDDAANKLAREVLAIVARREAELAERAKLLGELLDIFDAADNERLKEVHEHDAKAEKWQSEGDMYGWNFHKGIASGCTAASIIFFRVKRAIEKQLVALAALKGGAT